jgi:hypothetical protein
MATAQQFADVALSHVGEPGPNNTCLSNGVQKWAGEVGLPQLGGNTSTVSVYRAAAQKAGYYHVGMAGVQVGDILDWAGIGHVTVCTAISPNGGVQSVGSGTANGVVRVDPPDGGYNPSAIFRGYIRLPYDGKSSAVSTTADVTPAGSVSGLAGIIPSLTTVVSEISNPGFWLRAGLLSLGAALLVIALVKIVASTSAGQQAIKAGKSAVKDAAEIAVVK